MEIDRKTGHAPKVTQIAAEAGTLRSACIGCPGCRGICAALIEALSLPRAVLHREGQ